MCEARPGARCAADTARPAASTLAAYHDAYPDGPEVGTLTAALSAQGSPAQQPAMTEAHQRLTEAQDECTNSESAARDALPGHLRATRENDLAAQEYRRSAAATRAAGDAALARARELYIQEGVSPRMADFYVADMSERAGLSGQLATDGSLTIEAQAEAEAAESTAPQIKVKRSGPDAQATARVARIAAADPQYQDAVSAHRRAKETALAAREDQLRAGSDPAIRQYVSASERVRRARAALSAAESNRDLLARRQAAGLNLAGHPVSLAEADVFVNPDGSTNAWLISGSEADGTATYEPVNGTTLHRGPSGTLNRVLSTTAGTPVVATTDYANPAHSRTVRLWLDPPADGARPVGAATGGVVTDDGVDTSG